MNPTDIPLRDLHLPASVGWWPLAPGWWLLIVLAVAGLVWLAHRAYRKWQRGRPRRIALAEFKELVAAHKNSDDLEQLAKGLSALLRRAMLAYAPRAEVASLTGDDWLRWLDRGLPQPEFLNGPGQSLGVLPYLGKRAGKETVDVEALLRAVRTRLTTPLPEELR